MLGVTFFGIFLTPVFYVLLRQRRARRVAAKLEPVGGAGAAVAVGTAAPRRSSRSAAAGAKRRCVSTRRWA